MKFKDIARDYLIFDCHFHLRQSGRMLDAVRMFQEAGGNALNLTNIPDYSRGVREYYSKTFHETIRIASLIRSETGVRCAVTLGPYPLDFYFFRENSLDPMQEMDKGLRLAARLIEEGHACAIGEIGRPHFQTSDTEVFNLMIRKTFEVASDLKCPVIMHTEDLTGDAVMEIERFASEEHLPPEFVIKHHAIPANLTSGSRIRFSIPASRSAVKESLNYGKDFFLETDYVDDPAKGWKVLPPDAVPRRADMIMQYRDDWEEIFSRVFLDLPRKYFESCF